MNKKTEPEKKEKEQRSEKGFRSYFFRLFGKYDFRDKEQFVRFGKWLLFVLLLVVELFILLNHVNVHGFADWKFLVVILSIETIFTVSQALKLFVFRSDKMSLYAVDAALSCAFMFLTDGVYPIAVFMIVLTEFYITAEGTKPAVVMICVGSIIYEVGYILRRMFLFGNEFSFLPMFTQSFASLLTLLLHFLVVQIGLAFYRQFLKLNKTLSELKESKKELEKAYEVVAEVTALEERQRIAKDIHDTAGHSITTVIMQTEAAKRILEKNPEEAKSKIVAANLQAKHALEELRDSVHLLSGMQNQTTLRSALENIVHESTDGTNLTVRSQIQDVDVSPTKHRFLCNTLKEGISNGLRHGGATAFWFELREQDGVIAFLLSDNGKGADMKTLKLGFGLSAMQERAKSLGGEVRFDAEEGEGFELHLFLPSDSQHNKGENGYGKED
ncbi:MAG: sensor histidine kinase [Clostridia bacterium]|nr:sensor histidine kinase [Clostridia bacterium]